MTIESSNHKTSVVEFIGNVEISFSLFHQKSDNFSPTVKAGRSQGCGVTFGPVINIGSGMDQIFDYRRLKKEVIHLPIDGAEVFTQIF